MGEQPRHVSGIYGIRFWTVPVFLLLPLTVFCEHIQNEGFFVSVASRSMADAYETYDMVVSDFGGRVVIADQGIELTLNDPFNLLWPLDRVIDFVYDPIDIRWTAANRVYVELDETGWELLYSSGLGPEPWTPIGDLPNSSPSGKGWVIDLSSEADPALFRGRPTE